MVEEFFILFYFKNIHAMQPRLAFNYVAQTDFEFTTPLPQLTEFWDSKWGPVSSAQPGFFICLRCGLMLCWLTLNLRCRAEDGLELILQLFVGVGDQVLETGPKTSRMINTLKLH